MKLRGWAGALAAVALTSCGTAGSTAYSGTVQAPSAAVGSPVGGRVVAVRVSDGQRVRRGDVLARFDDARLRAALAAQESQVAAAAASLADLRAGARSDDLARAAAQARQADELYEESRTSTTPRLAALAGAVAQARAQLDDAGANARDAAIDASRYRALAATGDASQQARDDATVRAQRAAAQVAAARAALAGAQAQLDEARDATLPRTTAANAANAAAANHGYALLADGPRPDAVRQAQALLASARAAADDDAAHLDDTIVRAPADGVVRSFDLHVGDLIAPGAPVATIDEDGEPYVRIYIPQSQLAAFTVGRRVDVHPDANPSVTIPGAVEQVDAQAQFTPESVQTVDDRANLSFGVKVRIHDRDRRAPGGTTATVTLP